MKPLERRVEKLEANRGPHVAEIKAAIACLDAAAGATTKRDMAAAVRAARAHVETFGRLFDEEIADREKPILQSTEWQQIRTTLITALEPYLDARIAIAEALGKLDAEQRGERDENPATTN